MIDQKFFRDIPRRITDKGDMIIAADQMADTAFIVERGTAENIQTGKVFGPNSLLLPLEMLALEKYRSQIVASSPCAVICCPRHVLQNNLAREDRLTWPLSRSLAGDIMRRLGVTAA